MNKKLHISAENVEKLNSPIVEELSEIKPLISYKYMCRQGILEIHNQGLNQNIFSISFQDYRVKRKNGDPQTYCLFKRGEKSHKWLSIDEMIELPMRSRKRMFCFNSFEEARKFMLENCTYETDPKW